MISFDVDQLSNKSHVVTMFMHIIAGLSRRVILKDAETGRTQTYGVGSDVLAQQFALRVEHLLPSSSHKSLSSSESNSIT